MRRHITGAGGRCPVAVGPSDFSVGIVFAAGRGVGCCTGRATKIETSGSPRLPVLELVVEDRDQWCLRALHLSHDRDKWRYSAPFEQLIATRGTPRFSNA
jgi:hypothetical protein